MNVHYRHTQVGWITLGALLGFGSLATGLMLVAELTGVGLAVAAVSILLAALFGTLTVTVDRQSLVARFGIGLIRKKIDLSTVRAYEPVRTPWYYGWGIRIYPGGVLYNVSGLQAVEFTYDGGKRCRIGTDEPTELVAAVRSSIGELPSLSPASQEKVRRRARAFAVGIAIFMLLVFLVIGGMMKIQHHEPVVTVESDALVIDSLFYGDRYALSEIKSATLEQTLPRIRARTNGYALGGKLRGHFAVDKLGSCKLFIDRGVPPFVVVHVNGSYVVFNQEDPARTQLLYDQLRTSLDTPR
jgi:hypothetical protein